MPHLDEGTIHAWLDDALPVEERARAEAHAAECATCAAAVAEARGLIAASSRILSALDTVPGDVIPKARDAAAAAAPVAAAAARVAAPAAPSAAVPELADARARRRRFPLYARAAAILVVVTTGALVLRTTQRASPRVLAEKQEADTRASAPPQAVAENAAAQSSAPNAPSQALDRVQPSSNAVASTRADEKEKREPVAQMANKDLAAGSAGAAVSPPARQLAERLRSSAKGIPRTEGYEPKPDGTPDSMMRRLQATTLQAAGAPSAAGGRADAVSAPAAPEPAVDTAFLTDPDALYGAATAPRVQDESGVARAMPAPAKSNVAAVDSASVRGKLAAGVPLRLVASGRTTTPDQRVVVRRVYELSPGVRVTVDEAAPCAQRQSATDCRALSTKRAEEAPARDAPIAAGVNSIQWTDSTGTEYTLSGRLPVADLERLKPLIH